MFQLPPLRIARRMTILAGALTAIGACALLPFRPDSSATAPVLDGYGATTLTPAQANEAALAQDSECALCAWGVAWQLGPNINNTERDDLTEAIGHVGYAIKHSALASPRERALIESLALRYGHVSEKRNSAPLQAALCGTPGSDVARVDPLDTAYADRMRIPMRIWGAMRTRPASTKVRWRPMRPECLS